MNENSELKKEPAKKRNLTTQEQKTISSLKQKGIAESHPIFRAGKEKDKETIEFALDEKLEHNDALDLIYARIFNATGSANRIIGLHMISKAGKALISSKATNNEIAEQLDILTQSMQALAPQDDYEGQLVAQLLILHDHALDWLGRANRSERVDFANVYLNGASKLLNRHHETLEALLKYRRKGEQRVHVEHVHVHGGGQAIVGHVTTGGGLNQKLEEGPHAKV